jgi:drug/metabolite transporter (DMT)-like permease
MAAHPHAQRSVSTSALVAGFASIYLIWGSTYLAIRFVVETLPPFLAAGCRFVIAGAILWFILRLRPPNRNAPAPSRGQSKPSLAQWRAAWVVGSLMLAGGNGLVSWSELYIPSGITALIVGTMPLWMVLLDWILHRNARPSLAVIAGLVIGFAGVVLLASNGEASADGDTSKWGVAALLLACVFWAYGSLRSRRVDQGPSMLVASAMQMIGGGLTLLVIGTIVNEWPSVDFSGISLRSALAFLYLIFAGSLIGFTSYVWLLSVASPTAVSTYAYVNPVVAVFLGWWLGNETITGRTIIAGAMVVGAVALMTRRKKPATASTPAPRDEIIEPEAVI